VSCGGTGGGGGSSCTVGPVITEDTCEVATDGAPTGLWARYYHEDSTYTMLLRAQGVYPELTFPPPGNRTGYFNGADHNVYPDGWHSHLEYPLLPGACKNWSLVRVEGYVEIDAPGTYYGIAWWNAVRLQVTMDSDGNPSTGEIEIANSYSHPLDGNSSMPITFSSGLTYPHWFHMTANFVGMDGIPGFKFVLNGNDTASIWYWWGNDTDGAFIMKGHTSPCGPPVPPNSPPICSISGPTSAVSGYPLTFLVNGSDADSNLNRISVNYSPTTNEAWGTALNYNFPNTGAYSTSATITGGLPAGTYYVGCNAYDSATPVAACSFNPWCSEWLPNTTPSHTCSGWSDCGPNDYLTLTVSPYISPWFQASGGNVVARGNISSTIPAVTAYSFDFIKDPVALMIYNGSLPSLGAGKVSNVEVSANTSITSKPEASFDLFYNTKLPEDVKTGLKKLTTSNSVATSSLIGCNLVREYRVCYYDGAYNPGSGALGNLTLTGDYIIPDPASPGSPTNRIILFVDNASVTINGSIRSQTRGKSSFLLISEGEPAATSNGIVIGAAVGSTGTFADNIPDLEGVFYTDKAFVTSHAPTEDRNLHIRGSVIAGSFILERDLGSGATGEKNDRYPAEYFEYGTEQVMAFPPFLRLRSTSWSEVAP